RGFWRHLGRVVSRHQLLGARRFLSQVSQGVCRNLARRLHNESLKRFHALRVSRIRANGLIQDGCTMLNKHKVNTDKLEIRITAMVGVALLTALTMASGRAVADNGQSEDEVVTPVGSLVAFAGAAVPNGWLLCDGRAVSRTKFSALFAAIGTAWGV